jgi:hypothetical protein
VRKEKERWTCGCQDECPCSLRTCVLTTFQSIFIDESLYLGAIDSHGFLRQTKEYIQTNRVIRGEAPDSTVSPLQNIQLKGKISRSRT